MVGPRVDEWHISRTGWTILDGNCVTHSIHERVPVPGKTRNSVRHRRTGHAQITFHRDWRSQAVGRIPLHKCRVAYSPQLTTGTDYADQRAVEGHFLGIPVNISHVLEETRKESCDEQALRAHQPLCATNVRNGTIGQKGDR